MYWVEKRLPIGIFARDSNGTLVFRISSADLTDFNELDIGNPGSGAKWMHVYDQDGISWLTQFRRVDPAALPKVFDGAGQPIRQEGMLSLQGASEQAIGDLVARQRVEAELARITG